MIIYIQLTAWPDIEVKPVSKDLEFIVLACDGIWDVMTNEVWQILSYKVVKICHKVIKLFI